jgi:adenine phosphoribosyltransferase
VNEIMLEKLKKSLEEAPVIQKESDGKIYNYFIHPISDGIPKIDPALLEEITDYMITAADIKADRIVTIESMGIPIATTLSLKTGIPMTLVRKRKYGLPDEIEAAQKTGYSGGKIYANGLKRGDRIFIVDDVLSTGGTLLSLLKETAKAGIIVTGVFCVIGRGDGKSVIKKETGIDVVVLAEIDVTEKGITVIGGVA